MTERPTEQPVRFPEVVVDVGGLAAPIRVFKAARAALYRAGVDAAVVAEFRSAAFAADDKDALFGVIESWVTLRNLDELLRRPPARKIL